jgi:hypothetical protein
MTLKEGRQREHFYRILQQHYPDKVIHYHNIYKNDKWGGASGSYYGMLDPLVLGLSKKYRIPLRIPDTLFGNTMTENDKIMVMLEQIGYILGLQKLKNPYGYAAYKISQQTEPLADLFGDLRQIKGVGKTTELIIKEIIRTGTSSYYKKIVLNQ